jgi:lipooligosaccharide transport system permease protein
MAAVSSALPVLEHRLAAIRRTWRGSVFTSILLPVLFLLGLGVSVGTYVDRTGTLGVPYLDFYAPGLLASATVQIAVSEAMWPVFGAFEWHRLYHAMRATPLRSADIVGGELAYLAIRVGVPATTFVLVMTAFGAVSSWWAVLAVPAAVLLGLAVAAPTLAYTAWIRSDNMFPLLIRFVVIPMTLFAGVFFPVDAMPPVARWIAYVSPLWHAVELCRYATAGIPSALPVLAHVAYLSVWMVAGYGLARSRYTKRLTD